MTNRNEVYWHYEIRDTSTKYEVVYAISFANDCNMPFVASVVAAVLGSCNSWEEMLDVAICILNNKARFRQT